MTAELRFRPYSDSEKAFIIRDLTNAFRDVEELRDKLDEGAVPVEMLNVVDELIDCNRTFFDKLWDKVEVYVQDLEEKEEWLDGELDDAQAECDELSHEIEKLEDAIDHIKDLHSDMAEILATF